MSAEEASSLLNMGTTKKYDIPLAHLDYKYIEECNDVKYLEKILRILRSGEEGKYPEMEQQCEDKIEKLNPTSRILRKEIPIKKINEIDRNEGNSLQKDIQSWTSQMKQEENSVNGVSEFDDESLPPIRSGAISINGKSSQQKSQSGEKKKAMPRSYKEWDKFDVEKEVEEVDKETSKEPSRAGVQVVIENEIDSTGMSEKEKEMKANREKDKGNEAFRAGDFEEAIMYYSRSISLLPNPPSYNNRALAYLKIKEWMKAETDCDRVLSWEPQNIKALLRRGSARLGKKCFDEAMEDFQLVLKLEPNNKRAEELIKELKKEQTKYEEEKEERKKKGRRMVIEEVEEEEDTEKEMEKPKKGRKMMIEEVEEEEEEEFMSADEEIVVEEKDTFEKKKASVSVNSQELNKSESKKKDSVPLTNGFHEKPPKAKQDSKDIWDEGEVISHDTQGFTTLKTRPEEKNTQSENESERRSESTNTWPSQSVKQSESSGPSPQEIENSENENIANASVESTRMEEEPGDKTGSPAATTSGAVMEKPPEEVTLVKPVFIQNLLPGSIAKLREEGNQLFREGQYGDAIDIYTEALSKLEKEKCDQAVNRSLLHSNRAACHIKTGHCAAAIKDCTTSLELVPHAIKPLLRRGNAYEMLENYRKAYIDYKHVLNIDKTIDIAHQGSSRCQSHLQSVDGSKWREKLPRIPSVSPWEIPDIRTPEEAANAPSSSFVSSASSSNFTTSQSTTPTPPTESSLPPSSSSSSSSLSSSPSLSSSSVTSDKTASDSPKLPAKEESFNEVKARGNEHVKNSEFKSAVECYSRCVELDPQQSVSYTNRALCYIRINQPEKAEQDCTEALSLEKDNVKALFRRAQAKKMLKRYKDSLSDLLHLLKVDPKNTAAQKEVDIVKDYWRKELKSQQSPTSETKPASTNEKKIPTNEKSAQAATSPKINVSKTVQLDPSKMEEKSESKKGKQKTRKRMVIEEVDTDEKQPKTKQEPPKEIPNSSKSTNVHQTSKHKSASNPKQTGPSLAATPTQQTNATPTQQTNAPPPQSQGQQETKSKKKGKKNKSAGEHKSKESVSSPQTPPSSPSNPPPTGVSSAKTTQKSGIKATSTGLPVTPPVTPKLEKATPYEFIQVWNSLKNVTEIQPYADLLKQIPPKDLPQVISNKLDGGMLNKITKCVAEKFIKQGETDLSYSILHHLTKVPRFSTVSLFLSPNEKKDLESVMSSLQKSDSSQYSTEDLSSLRKQYGV